ncbi:hypothetical protein F8568_035300 [Actinomadura sp. LD22]|uniref:Uncharacterized protein n=1 Tax=Actinomadura physcomitrii TaxID=2650748 RepID=A0A6I4MQ98_9ACTN|nr:hypothetical protein [Actinomadura physcomitrii]MWA05541.1 hypothetical protein [Actinomadura physcomitrii]
MSEALEGALVAAMDEARDRHGPGAEDVRASLPLTEPTGFVDLGCLAVACVVIAVPVLLIGSYSTLIKVLIVAVVVAAGFLVVRSGPGHRAPATAGRGRRADRPGA